ncbi:MAG: hypothetical protein MUP90_00175 [Gammaproteobacteria bacterium]|nr:hypothetical protein [Gammaproteobacteria bacterium]
MFSRTSQGRSPFLQAVAVDDAIPIDPQAVELWLNDLDRRSRWFIRPLLQFFLSMLLYVTWAFKRLPLPQFRAHTLLQKMICFFCRWFVSPEANELIIRHFTTESNILNFMRENTGKDQVPPLELYPSTINDMLTHTFVDHDQELFRMLRDLGPSDRSAWPIDSKELKWSLWQPMKIDPSVRERRWTQALDFETAHALFMCLFCFLLTAEEYRDAINGFNLDQSIAAKIGEMIGDPTLVELAYNKYPLYLLGPGNLGQRFLMHGFFTEYLHARLEQERVAA